MPKDTKTKMGKFSRFLILYIGIFLLVSGQAGAQSTPSAILYSSPSSTPIKEGAEFTIDIRENSNSFKVNVVDVHLSYPEGELEVDTGDIKGNSSFNIIQKNVSDGIIRIVAATLSDPKYVVGDQSIATVTFTAAEDTNSGKVALNQSASAIASCGKNILKVQGDPGCTYVPPAPAATAPTQPVSPDANPVPSKPASHVPETAVSPAQDDNISVSIASPSSQRRQEQNQVGFWVPMLVLAGTLLVSTMAASGFTAGGIFKHFRFLRPVNRFKHYPRL